MRGVRGQVHVPSRERHCILQRLLLARRRLLTDKKKNRPPKGYAILKVSTLAEAILLHLEREGEMQFHQLLNADLIKAQRTDLTLALKMLQRTRLVKKTATFGVTTMTKYSLTRLGAEYVDSHLGGHRHHHHHDHPTRQSP